MAKKTQLPVVGGLRKVIIPGSTVIPGTTIAELGSSTITLAQLAQLIGNATPANPGTISPGSGIGAAAIAVGPGLSGGGSLVGVVPLRLVAPMALIGEDGTPGEDGLSGVIGHDGKAGINGPAGIAGLGLDGDQGEDGLPGINGGPGPLGLTGPAGGQTFGAYWVTVGGGVVTLPLNAVERVMNAAGTIKEIIIVTKGGPGSCTIQIYKANLSVHYPPTPADDITGGAPPAISSGTTYQNSTLTGYTLSFAQDDVYLFTLSANTNFTSVGIFLRF